MKSKKKNINGLLLAAFLLVLALVYACSSQKQEHPNILLFIADDMTWRDCEPYGNPDIRTPHISRLASEGMCLDNMFTSTAMCSPTRQQLFTGLYPVKSGAFPNHSRVYRNVKSLVHHFGSMDYRVALIGKTHFGPESSFPFEYLGGLGYNNRTKTDHRLENIKPVISGSNEQPFFLIIASNQPHAPWNKKSGYAYHPDSLDIPDYIMDTEMTRSKLVSYYHEISYADSLLGDCLEYIDQAGIADNTIVIFTSEQGSQLPFAKWTCYDLGLKTAFIIRWPGTIQAGSRNDALTQYVDVVPTLIEAAGQDPDNFKTMRLSGKEDAGFDGISFMDVLTDNNSSHRNYVYGIHTTRGIINGSEAYPVRSVRSRQFKYIVNLNYESPFYNITNTDEESIYADWLKNSESDTILHRWVARYQFRPGEELYDIRNDPFEMVNLAENPEYNSIREELRTELNKWMESQGDMGIETEMGALQRIGSEETWKSWEAKNFGK